MSLHRSHKWPRLSLFTLGRARDRRYMVEHLVQGDFERARGLPRSFNCDRDTVVVPWVAARSIASVCEPLMSALASYAPSVAPIVRQLESNKAYYVELAASTAFRQTIAVVAAVVRVQRRWRRHHRLRTWLETMHALKERSALDRQLKAARAKIAARNSSWGLADEGDGTLPIARTSGSAAADDPELEA